MYTNPMQSPQREGDGAAQRPVYRKATRAEELRTLWGDPEDRTSFILAGQRAMLEKVLGCAECAFLSEYSRNYKGWSLWDEESKITVEIAHCVHDISKTYGYFILGDTTFKLRNFLNQHGVRTVQQRPGLLWIQDGFREATAEEEKKTPFKGDEVSSTVAGDQHKHIEFLFGPEGSFKDKWSASWRGWPLWCMQTESMVEIARPKSSGINAEFSIFGDKTGTLRNFLRGNGIHVVDKSTAAVSNVTAASATASAFGWA